MSDLLLVEKPEVLEGEVENRAEVVYRELLSFLKIVDQSWLEIGKRMSEIQDRQHYLHFGCATLEEFCRKKLNRGSRQVSNYARDYKLYVEELKIPEKRLLEIGSSKLTVMAPVVTAENVDEWLKYAKKSTVRDIDNRKALTLGGQGLDQVEEEAGIRSRWQIGVTPAVKQLLNQAIEEIRRQTGSEDINVAVEYMAANTLSGLHAQSEGGVFTCFLNREDKNFIAGWLNSPDRNHYPNLGAYLVACLRNDTSSLAHGSGL